MGYFTRKGHKEPFYFSPRRIAGLMRRCGIGEFIVSSTNAQVECIAVEDIFREAEEMKRVAGDSAHLYFWLSARLYDDNPDLDDLSGIGFEGFKLHEEEGHWIRDRERDLGRVLEYAAGKKMNVQFHSSGREWCEPWRFRDFALSFPQIKFDLAHCSPPEETFEVMAECENVYTDTSMTVDYSPIEDCSEAVRSRIMFGTDFPACHYRENGRFADDIRRWQRLAARYAREMDEAFKSFVAKK